MKKTKILTVLGVLVAMGVTACNGGASSEEPVSSKETPATSQQAPSSEAPSSQAPSSQAPSSQAPSSSTPAPSSSTPAQSSTPAPSSSSEAPAKSVSYVSSSFVLGTDNKMTLVVTGTQHNYSAAELKFAFGLSDGTNFVVGKAEPADADYNLVPVMGTDGGFTLTIALEDLVGIAEGEFNVYMGPKGGYVDVTSALNIEKGTKSGLKYRFGTRDDDGRLQIAELPPINFTEAFIKVVENKPVLYFGGAFAGTEAEVTAYTPWVQVQSVPNAQGYESGFESWGNHDLTAVIKVENNKAYVTADISALPNACYNTHFNLKGQHSGEAIMENAIDQSTAKVRCGGKDYWCWSDPDTSDQAHFWGHLGFVIADAAILVTPNLNYTDAPAMDPISASKGKITLPADPTREGGYSFAGWFDAAEGGNEVTNDTVYNEDTTIYAHWASHTHQAAAEWSKDDTQHWHACAAAGCPVDGYKMDAANHDFGDWTVTKAATCDEAGERQHSCNTCGQVVKEVVAKLAHTYEAEPAQSNAAGTGYVATKAYNCTAGCEKSALRWSALDFDATASTAGFEVNADNVRFKSGEVENKGGAASTGTHIVYNINVSAAVAKAGLAFRIKNTGGANGTAPVFGTISGDTSLGAIDNGDGTYTTTTKRYGLKVNDVFYPLGDDSYGNQASVTAWFDWPVEFPLVEGINKVEIIAYAGYRANMYEFQFTGLPQVVNTHTHALGEWQSNDTNHWKECSGADCPAGAGAHLEEAAHDFGAVVEKTAPTCDKAGVGEKECSVCHKKVEVAIPALGHTFVNGEKTGEYTPAECSTCHAKAYVLDVASPAKLKKDLSWNITGLEAGEYEIQLYACASSTTLTQKYDNRYQFKVDDAEYIGASDNNASYASYGLGTGEAIGNCKWSSAINQITIGAEAASFTIHWTDKGYSAFIGGVRLVKIA